MKKSYLTSTLLFIIVLLSSCGKDDNETSNVPYALVEININTIVQHQFNNPYYSKLYTEKGYTGYAGVIAISNSDASWIYAYDLCCPHEAPMKNILEKNNDLTLKCPKCGSIYNISDGYGSVVSGPSKERLKKYRVIKDNNTYRIRN